MNNFESVINYLRNIFRKEGITGMDSIKHSIFFILSKFLTIDTCKIYNIENKYSFDKLRFDENNKLLDYNLLMKKIYNKTINCLVNQIYDKLHFNLDFKIENYNNINLILNKLNDIDINNLHLEFDIIGTIYELHLKTGTSQAMRDLGQYYSNRYLINYMIKLCKPEINESILDPTCGSGGFLSMSIKYLNDKYKNINWVNYKQYIHGYDVDDNVKNMTLLNLLLETGQLFDNTILKLDSLKINNNNKYDIILANEPFGLKNIIYDECCDKIKNLKIKGNKGEPLFIQLMMESLNINGRCCVIVPEGILFNESKLYLETRKYLIKNYNLKKIIYMNDSFFMNTNVKCAILFFTNEENKTLNIKFIEIKFIDNIINETLLVNVNIKSIIENNYNLNLNKYIKNNISKIENIEYKKLGEICKDIPTNKNISYSNRIDGIFRYFTCSKNESTHNEYNYDGTFIIHGCLGSTIKDSIFMTNNEKFSIGTSMIISEIKNKNEYDTKYIYYYLKLNQFIFNKYITGSAIPVINKSNYYDIEIPIPSLEIQNKIVSMLDTYNNQIENNKKSIINYDLLKKYIVEINTNNCKQIKNLGEICLNIKTGKNKPIDNKTGTLYPYYGTGNITGYTDEYLIDGEYILTPRNGSIGQMFYISGKSFPSDHMFIIKECSEHIKYIYYVLNYRTDLSKFAHGSTIKGIKKNDLLNIKIPITTLEIQERIIKDCEYYDKQIEILKKRK